MRTFLKILAVPPILYVGTILYLCFEPYIERKIHERLHPAK